ncbi:hypothetical protein [uncultured Robinsoniella sp.]|uniref:hypothetical protein n=1 Tax=uncultured Robinsoniella sp. TaxID=904190 RepID=UPI00374E861F
MKNNNMKYIIAGVVVLVVIAVIATVVVTGKKKNNSEDKVGKTEQTSETQTEQKTESTTKPTEEKTESSSENSEENVITAMYLTYGEDNFIFIDTKNGTLFTAPIPEGGLVDKDGKQLSQEDLTRGNILKIYGNGIMLQSYPGQYPGVTKMVLDETGKPEDADQYNELIDQIYQEPDPAEPPYLSMEYSQTEAIVSAAITRGGYEWSYEKEDGITDTAKTDISPVLGWKEINDLTLNEPTDLKLDFSKEPNSVEVIRWAEDVQKQYSEGSDVPEGEKVELKEKDGALYIPSAEAGYTYQVTAKWDNGMVDYGFVTKSKN